MRQKTERIFLASLIESERSAAGKQADLIIVGGNPATNIADIEKVEFVFRKGVGYDPVKLLDGIHGVVGLEN